MVMRAVARWGVGVVATLVAGELAVRAAALVLRRDAAPPAATKVVFEAIRPRL